MIYRQLTRVWLAISPILILHLTTNFHQKPTAHAIRTAKMPTPISLFSVNAILIMSTDDSSRIFAKYYSPPHPPTGIPANSSDYPGANPYPTVKDQKSFEKGLLEKTAKQTSDIILYDNRVVVFKTEGDVMLYVVGGAEENEVLLYNVVIALRDSLNILLRYVLKLYFLSSLLSSLSQAFCLFGSKLTGLVSYSRTCL